ncbi:MAG: FRG domain-containing protein [bacterium]
MNRIKVESVEEAVYAAEQLKRSGRPYWFRGQAKGWPLRSSFVRINQADRNLALEKVARYEEWVKHTPGLEHLVTNTDAAIAVAQHYGIPTNFVDFTTHPEIAGFFASEKAGFTTAGDLACIICLDVQDFKEFWKLLAQRYAPPEFLEIAVPDLWRLEAQHGCFLFCPYDNVERLYDFDRIFFPNNHVLRGIRREDVYPKRKSHLEVLLDQYFMNERMIEAERTWNPEGVKRLVFEAPTGGCDPDVFPNGLPEHPSWSYGELRPWLDLHAEQFSKAWTAVNFRVLIPDPRDTSRLVRKISEQLLHDLFGLAGIRSKLVGWHIQLKADYGLPQDFESRLASRLARLWDGLRRLPYSDKDISLGFGLCIAFAVALGGDFVSPDSRHWERAAHQCLVKPIELEFGAEDGSYSRGYASVKGLAASIRSDILSYVADEWKDQLAENVRGILQTAWTPKQTFDFVLLTPLFAREIAPYQVLARDTAVFYSPARLSSLGLP